MLTKELAQKISDRVAPETYKQTEVSWITVNRVLGWKRRGLLEGYYKTQQNKTVWNDAAVELGVLLYQLDDLYNYPCDPTAAVVAELTKGHALKDLLRENAELRATIRQLKEKAHGTP